ncbi:MAG TPA: hypothetical protein PLH57_02615 [Oligoflexia bacterium]|nr:hypothetical protein [Oligoflexia bacterium]
MAAIKLFLRNMLQSRSRIFAAVCLFGFAAQVLIAFCFQSRAWVDEIWVTFNPAYSWIYRVGELDVDWVQGVRSWLAPLLVGSILRVFHALGLTDGQVVLPLMRILLATVTFAAKGYFILTVARKLGLRSLPWLAGLFVFLTPEFLRYSTFGELAALALPLLLVGLVWLDQGSPSKLMAGLCLIALSCALRYPFVVILGWIGLMFLFTRQYRKFQWAFVAGLGFVLFDLLLNSAVNGQWTSPFLHYAYADLIDGKPARDGVTPFYFAFELLWRFMTEPLFVLFFLAVAFSPKKLRPYWGATLSLLLLHTLFGHKEYRYFYPIAVLGAALAGLVLQYWFETTKWQYRRQVLVLILTLFLSFAAWRGSKKTRWNDYQTPSVLETWVGAQTDVRGLLVYGWNGIYSGGHYTFHRPLPYSYAIDRDHLRRKRLDPHDYNYVVTSRSENPPCKERRIPMRTIFSPVEDEGAVYRCTLDEIHTFLSEEH